MKPRGLHRTFQGEEKRLKEVISLPSSVRNSPGKEVPDEGGKEEGRKKGGVGLLAAAKEEEEERGGGDRTGR